jgi:hypothetical protein
MPPIDGEPRAVALTHLHDVHARRRLHGSMQFRPASRKAGSRGFMLPSLSCWNRRAPRLEHVPDAAVVGGDELAICDGPARGPTCQPCPRARQQVHDGPRGDAVEHAEGGLGRSCRGCRAPVPAARSRRGTAVSSPSSWRGCRSRRGCPVAARRPGAVRRGPCLPSRRRSGPRETHSPAPAQPVVHVRTGQSSGSGSVAVCFGSFIVPAQRSRQIRCGPRSPRSAPPAARPSSRC